MTGWLTALLSYIGRKSVLWAAIILAALAFVGAVFVYGIDTGKRQYRQRETEARNKAMRRAKEVRDDVNAADPDDLRDRSDRWLRD